MANTKITTNVIADGAITSAKLDSSSLSIPSTATATTQSAGDNSTKVATTAYVETAVANLVSAAPATLDTLDELAAALGDDANFATTVTDSLALKAPLASPDFTGNVQVGTDSGDAFNSGALFRGQTTGAGYIQMKIGDTASGGILIGDTTDDFRGGLISYGTAHSTLANNTIIFANNNQTITASPTGVRLNGNSIARDPLHVHRASTGDCQIHMTNTSTGTSSSDGMTIFANSGGSGIWQRENTYFRIATNNTERFRLAAGGELTLKSDTDVIATFMNNSDNDHNFKFNLVDASDLAVMYLNGKDGGDNKFIIGYGSTHTSTPNMLALKSNTASGELGFFTDATQRMHITPTGEVGIGTDNPNEILELSQNQNPHLRFNNADTSVLANDIFGTLEWYTNDGSSSATGIAAEIRAYADVDFTGSTRSTNIDFLTASGTTAPTTRMTIQHDGNVGIGTDSPSALLELETSPAGSTQTKALLLDVNPTGNIGSGYLEIHTGTGSTAKTQIEQVAGGAGGLYGTYQDTNIINTTSSSIVAGNINFVTGGAIRMTVGGGSQAGNVGIGTTSPDTKLDVQGAIQASESGGDFIRLQTDGNNNIFDINSGAYVFRTSGFAERVRILATGGLTFNGDTAAANALDDYEEGTWTPKYNSVTNFSSAHGHYQKIGNRVFFSFYIQMFSSSNANRFQCVGLPFNTTDFSTNPEDDANRGFMTIGYTNYGSAFTVLLDSPSTDTFAAYTYGGAGITLAQLSGKAIYGAGSYITSS